MYALSRYFRLWFALGRFGLVRELAFRGNFLVKVTVELLWLVLLLVFWEIVFAQTQTIATWTKEEYMFFVGCYMTLEGLLETFFFANCGEFSELVRSGDLDFALLKPIDEQFLITCRSVEWTTVPNVFVGMGVMINALVLLQWPFDPLRVALFVLLLGCSLGLAYSFLLSLTSTAVWMVRNQSLYELWWLFTTLIRYPREIFRNTWADPLGRIFTFIIPVMLMINVPADVMVRGLDQTLEWPMIALMLFMTVMRRE